MSVSRRAFALGSAAALAGCGTVSTTTTNGVTTLTVNVAKIDTYAQAFASGAGIIALLPGVTGTSAGTTIGGVATAVNADRAAFDTVAGGSVSLSFNSNSVPAALTSILNDGKTLAADAGALLPGLPSGATLLSVAQPYIDASQALVAIIQGLITAPSAAAGVAAPKMTESKALAILLGPNAPK